jgi:hypothetical protein
LAKKFPQKAISKQIGQMGKAFSKSGQNSSTAKRVDRKIQPAVKLADFFFARRPSAQLTDRQTDHLNRSANRQTEQTDNLNRPANRQAEPTG